MRRAFSVVELLFALALIGILTALLMPAARIVFDVIKVQMKVDAIKVQMKEEISESSWKKNTLETFQQKERQAKKTPLADNHYSHEISGVITDVQPVSDGDKGVKLFVRFEDGETILLAEPSNGVVILIVGKMTTIRYHSSGYIEKITLE